MNYRKFICTTGSLLLSVYLVSGYRQYPCTPGCLLVSVYLVSGYTAPRPEGRSPSTSPQPTALIHTHHGTAFYCILHIALLWLRWVYNLIITHHTLHCTVLHCKVLHCNVVYSTELNLKVVNFPAHHFTAE